jgi:hypothetical protein
MEGTIKQVVKDQWQDRTFYRVNIEENKIEYACWQAAGANLKIGDKVDFTEEEKSGRFKMILKTEYSGKGGYKARSPEEIKNQLLSFSMSYAKDIITSQIHLYKDDNDVSANLFKYANSIYQWLKTTG